jgi:hydrogenase nickel incorporation protein HypA/HybF
MHEMSIVMQIIETAKSSVPDDMHHTRIEQVNVRIGRLSCVVPDNLRFCFTAATDKTPLADTKLNIEEISATARCHSCQHDWIIDGPVFMCKKCNAKNIEVVSGRELEILSIDIAD